MGGKKWINPTLHILSTQRQTAPTVWSTCRGVWIGSIIFHFDMMKYLRGSPDVCGTCLTFTAERLHCYYSIYMAVPHRVGRSIKIFNYSINRGWVWPRGKTAWAPATTFNNTQTSCHHKAIGIYIFVCQYMSVCDRKKERYMVDW